MILGKFALGGSLLLFLISIYYFVLAEYKSEEKYARIARAFFLLASSSVLLLVLLLFFLIFTHQFQYAFVYQYSSSDLPGYYLFSTFWAGQAGTFLMWAFFSSVYGMIFLKSQSNLKYIVLAVISSVIAFLIILTMKVNPFEYIWNTMPESFSIGQIPIDGRGLNPLLQNYWMVIHPPILFAGYSSTIIPFALVTAKLLKKKSDDFIHAAQTWTLFSLIILGTGIIMGGYWAYTTLGWGGYWAWDPVENSSLVPWVLSVAFLHGLIIEKRKKGLVKSNIIMGGLPFIAMLYGSFLTRSGVLADFSVHSFIDQGINFFLVSFLLFYLFLFLFLMGKNLKTFEALPLQTDFFVKDNFITYGILLTTVFGILVFVGTSAPLITSFIYADPANVGVEYYNIIATSIGIVLLILMGVAPFLPWKVKNMGEQKKLFSIVFFISLVVTVLMSLEGLNIIRSIVIMFSALFALLLNAKLVFTNLKRLKTAGIFLAHVGISLMIIGIITSGMYSDSARIAISKTVSDAAFGYNFSFNGLKTGERGHDFAEIDVKKKDEHFLAKPQFYFSNYTGSYMTTPHVRNYLFYDLYIAPVQLLKDDDVPEGMHLELHQNLAINTDSMQIKLENLSMERIDADTKIKAFAHIKIHFDRDSTTLSPAIIVDMSKRTLEPAFWQNKKIKISLVGLNVDQKTATVFVHRNHTNETNEKILVLEISTKPFIAILWLGAIVLMIGLLLSLMGAKKNLRE